MGGATLSKSLIQFSVDGWGCVPSLLFTWGQMDGSDGNASAHNAGDVFLEFSCFFNDPVDVGNLISGSSAFSDTNLNIMVHELLKPASENFEDY